MKPNANITRQEAAVLSSKILKMGNENNPYSISSFKDSASVAEWAKPAVTFMVGMKYINGYADSTLKPEKSITRAEAVTILSKIAGEIVNKSGVFQGI